MSGGPPKPTKPQPFWKSAQLASVGLEMGLSVLIGWGIGRWLDKKFHTDPWLMIVFLLFGVAAGFKTLLSLKPPGSETPDTTNEPPPGNGESQ